MLSPTAHRRNCEEEFGVNIYTASLFVLTGMKDKQISTDNNRKRSPEKRPFQCSRLKPRVEILKTTRLPKIIPPYALWNGDVLGFLKKLPETPVFDLVVTSPPYNIGKAYEKRQPLKQYLEWQTTVIDAILRRVKRTGSICWQIGNYIQNSCVEPLDFYLHPIFKERGLILRNRIIWRFGHGLHCRKRFSGRYEVILWYTKSENYIFNLDSVRIPSKYPGKRSYKGPNVGKLSSNPDGKNPEDVWDIPNVKANHREKTNHPCQFPVALIERLVLGLTNVNGLVFDPFCGVGSTGVAAAVHQRRFWGCDIVKEYIKTARTRIGDALADKPNYRPHSKPIYDHTKSPLSLTPFTLEHH